MDRAVTVTVAVTVPGSLEAVVFDLDGVLIESEEIWDDVRERYIRERGGRYDDEAQRAMMGMSSTEWSRYIHEELGVAATPVEINADVVASDGGALPRATAARAGRGRKGAGDRRRLSRSRSRRRRTAS